MKYLYIIILIIFFTSCKNDNPKINEGEIENIKQNESVLIDTIQILDKDIQHSNKSISIELKQKKLIEKKDERKEFKELIVERRYIINNKDYTINFNYPLLNVSLKPTHINFNNFIEDNYVNATKVKADILETKSLCDSIAATKFREERFIDYKIYNLNDQILSVLFYKENYYSGAMHPSYTFDCFNFELNKGVFMTYEDFFSQGSEEELLTIINEKINTKIGTGEMFYECWELSSDDFLKSKNNFVLNETYLEFYFDDCVICPSFTGTYSIKLPLIDLLSVLKKYELNSLNS